MIAPLPGATMTKPGSCTLPLPGIFPAVIDENGNEAKSGQGGYLVLQKPWPSHLRTIWGDDERYVQTYYPQPSPTANTMSPAIPQTETKTAIFGLWDGLMMFLMFPATA